MSTQKREIPQPFQAVAEEITHSANDFLNNVGELIHMGNLRKLALKDRNGATLLEMPFSTALIGSAIAFVVLPGRWLAVSTS